MRRKKPPRLIFGALVACLIVCGVAAIHTAQHWHKTVRITLDSGGRIDQFYERYSRERLKDTQFIIDGVCISACTMIVALIPPRQVCITPYAKLAFHSAHDGMGGFSPEGTRLLWHIYPVKIRELLRKHEWDGEGETADHPDLIYIEGDELLTLFRPCE